MATIFLDKEKGGRIVHDPRIIWNTQDIVAKKGGVAIQSKTGHVFMKQTMRANAAIYGGEISGHHYFRDFAHCDSGMIPWLLITELLSRSGRSLAEWLHDRIETFPSSGEKNFRVHNAPTAIYRVVEAYRAKALSLDQTDGISLTFENWRFNLRHSSTEPYVRLNIESRGCSEGLAAKIADISKLIEGTAV